MDKSKNKSYINYTVILYGKSGVGKSTIARLLELKYGMKSLPSYTTRPPRSPFEEGHTFVTEEEFKKLKPIAYTKFDGFEYCATAQQLRDYQVYIADINGVNGVINAEKEGRLRGTKLIVIRIEAPVLARFRRMLKRGDSIADAIRRIKHDRQAFDESKRVQYPCSSARNRDLLRTVYDIRRHYVRFAGE